jgi:hypothetical protein
MGPAGGADHGKPEGDVRLRSRGSPVKLTSRAAQAGDTGSAESHPWADPAFVERALKLDASRGRSDIPRPYTAVRGRRSDRGRAARRKLQRQAGDISATLQPSGGGSDFTTGRASLHLVERFLRQAGR